VMHELRWRKEISGELATIALDRLAAAEVSPRRPKGLIEEAWRIADRLGWAKTYDAEYLALARLLRCRLLTTDAKLKASGSAIVKVIGPADLKPTFPPSWPLFVIESMHRRRGREAPQGLGTSPSMSATKTLRQR